MQKPSQPPPVIETFDDEKIPDEKDHKRDRDVSFSMAALPIPLGPLGGLSSLAGKRICSKTINLENHTSNSV